MKKIIISLSCVLALITSCKKGYLDVNTNPNTAISSSAELVLPNAEVRTTALLDNPLGTFNFVSGWMGYTAISGSYAISTADFTTYKETTAFGEGAWQALYDNLADYDYVVKNGDPFYKGVGMIMKAIDFHYLVDLFNNIPYTEALQGVDNIHPKYDDAATIYGDLFNKIDTAMNLIRISPNTPSAKADLIFTRINNGATPVLTNVQKSWIQFANTVKLRMLERMANMPVKPSYFNAALAKVVGDPNGFITIDVTVNPGYLNTAGKLSPFYGSNYNASGTYINDFWRANAFAIAQFQSASDPRLGRVYNTVLVNNNPTYVGNSLGVQGAVGSKSSTFGPGVVQSFDQSTVVMLAAESYFIQAEAAVRGWLPSNARALYEQGVRESFRYLGLQSSQADSYLSNGSTTSDWTTASTVNDKISIIIGQKYLAEDMINVLEPYCDYRRFLNSGINIKIFNSQLAGGILTQSSSVDVRQIPVRLLYPRSELNTNAGNVPANIDHHTSKIFWMP